jgi:methanogenic corrinoid protein MtbC1
MQETRGLVQSVPKTDGVDDLATTGATKTCDADLTRVILQVLECRVGELWHQGRLIIAVEHYATQLIQQKMYSVMNQLPVNEFGSCVLIGCPEGESHKIGVQAVAYIAATRGCHVYYLGPNIPSSDRLDFCERIKPDLVLLSITEIKSDAEARTQLRDLEVIAAYWPVAVDGQGARAIGDLLRDTKIELLDALRVFLTVLF